MKRNFKKFLEDHENATDPIGNYDTRLSLELGELHGILRRLRKPGDTLVNQHKRALGRQTGCWVGGKGRMWVWVTPVYTVYVNNSYGVAFELSVSIKSLKDAEKAFESYKHKMTTP